MMLLRGVQVPIVQGSIYEPVGSLGVELIKDRCGTDE